MKEIVLGLGSNREYRGLSPLEILSGACTMLCDFVHDVHFSSVYRTAAMYKRDQSDFYNLALMGKYEADGQKLLEDIHSVENFYGRNRALEVRNGPRSLDVDIEFYGKEVIDCENLQVPHPRVKERGFVLIPLLEILKKNADVNKRDNFPDIYSFYGELEESLRHVENQQVVLSLSSEEFKQMVDERAVYCKEGKLWNKEPQLSKIR